MNRSVSFVDHQHASRRGSRALGLTVGGLAFFLLGFGLGRISTKEPVSPSPSNEVLPPDPGVSTRAAGVKSAVASVKPTVASIQPVAPETSPPPPRLVTPEEMERRWGIRVSGVGLVMEGAGLYLTYTVVSPEKIALLSDSSIPAYLLDHRSAAQISLRIPASPGAASAHSRARSAALAGRQFWTFPAPRNKLVAGGECLVLLSNQERRVQSGDRLSLVLGDLRLDGLVVQ